MHHKNNVGAIWFRRGYGSRSSESLSPINVKSGTKNKRRRKLRISCLIKAARPA